MKKTITSYCIYAMILGFLGNALLSVASDKVNTVNNRTNVVRQSIGK